MSDGGQWIVRCFYGLSSGGLDFTSWPDGSKIKSREDAEILAKWHTEYQLENYGVCNSRYEAYYLPANEKPWGR